MFGDTTIFGVAEVSMVDYHFFEPSEDHPKGFVTMKIRVKNADGETFGLTLFGAGAEPIKFSAPALENRPCAACGNLMPRDYHPRVTVCAACETEGAALANTGG